MKIQLCKAPRHFNARSRSDSAIGQNAFNNYAYINNAYIKYAYIGYASSVEFIWTPPWVANQARKFDLMKMRELEQRSGVHRETIRVYLRNGLLPEPVRTKPNVAEYGEEHVRGVMAIRRLQTNQRLSLDEIKQALNGRAIAVPGDPMTLRHLDELVATRLGADQSLVPLSSVGDRNPKAEVDAKAMHKVGAIQLVTRKGVPMLSRLDAQIVGIWGDMRAAGFSEKLGFDAELASIYVSRADDLAQAEISAFLERVGDFPREKKAEWAEAGLTCMMNLFSLLRMKAALKAIREME